MGVVTSQRKRKKQASSLGLSERELVLAELLEEVLDAVRWMQILGFTNQYLLHQKLDVSPRERDKILEAATRAVDKDAKLHEWRERLARVKGETLRAQRAINRAKKDMARGRAAPLDEASDAD